MGLRPGRTPMQAIEDAVMVDLIHCMCGHVNVGPAVRYFESLPKMDIDDVTVCKLQDLQ